jgi:hypothetical protein
VTVTATFRCGACSKVAATVTLVDPGDPDPRLTPEPLGAPPGISTLFSSIAPDSAQLSIDGGPLSVTHGLVLGGSEEIALALERVDAAALYRIDSEYAPFWCPTCCLAYCRDHFQSWPTFDDGFYDATYGICAEGHRRKLDD